MDILAELPAKLHSMHDSVSNLPPMDSSTVSALLQLQMSDPGKRQWESNKTGYLNWAVNQLLAKSKRDEGSAAAVNDMKRFAEIGQTEDLKKAIEAAEGVRADLDRVEDRPIDDSMDTSS
jgi:kinetochore protein Mis12/MTW1